MATQTPTQEQAIVRQEPAAAIEFSREDPVSLYMNAGAFGQVQRVATLMASSQLVPVHLRHEWEQVKEKDEAGKEKLVTRKKFDRTADCFLVVAQAMRWGIDPFAAAQCSFVTSGKLGYEGKLIAAVINSQPRLERKLNYTYTGEGRARRVTVSGRLRGEAEMREITGSVAEWATNNEKWKSMPDQMLSYRGAREWARRHMPEAVLGVYSEDELQEVATLKRSAPVSGAPLVGEVVVAGPDPLLALAGVVAQQQQQAARPAADPLTCTHPSAPPSMVDALKPGETLACGECGSTFRGEGQPC